MNVNLRAIIVSVLVSIGGGLGACTTQEAKNGTGGTGVGTGGSGGGSTGTGGGGGGRATNDGVTCLPPDRILADFTYDADGGSTTEPRFGTFGTSLSGGGSAYGSLMSNVTSNDWHLMGTIADFSGFGLYFDNVNNAMCNRIDASAFAGISFTIWGSLPAPNMLTMGVSTLANAVAGSWLVSIADPMATGNEPGRCFPTSGTRYYHPGCGDATYAFPVTGTQAAPQTVTIPWNTFAGGMPQANVTPAEILGMYWFVTWAAGATQYPVDIHIDNLAFIPK